MNTALSKHTIATLIAVIFHLVGLTGILVFKSESIIQSTPINLLLSLALLIWTQEEKNASFWLLLIICFAVGFFVEVIGVNTGMLFGEYSYGAVLGPQWKGVPFIIGVNWFIVIYCCGIFVQTVWQKMLHSATEAGSPAPGGWFRGVATVTDAATMAVIFDWLIEPIAIQLGYWKWKNGDIPLYNYVCWFGISLLLLLVFKWLPFSKRNKFAIHLLMIQAMFFLLLRIFLSTP